VEIINPDSQSSGQFNFTVTNATTTTNLALGIDVSAGNGTISWSAVSGAGIQFAYLKATESTFSPDSKFSANTNGAIGQHILVGAYHFATPLFSPAYFQSGYDHQDTASEEASNFVNTAKGIIGPGFLPPSLDVEDQVVTWVLVNGVYQPSVWADPLTDMGASALAQWINDWVSKVEQLTHTNSIPLIYCDRAYATALSPYLNGTVKLWIADINSSAGNPNTTGWQAWPWVFHQYSWSGSVGGISPVDLDVFNGNLTALNTFVNGGTQVTSPPSFTGSHVSSGALQTTLSGLSSGATVVMQVSSDLKNWTPMRTNVVNGSTLSFTNTINPAMKGQFFRAVVQ
jgi:GH25 family lysozyme M1 (1,4-beta-N-acetylmuramidase)